MSMHRARAMWEAVERYHGLCYIAPEPRTSGTEAGLKGFWMNYFATRAAPMGPVAPEVVESTFFYYAPHRVHRAIPDAWSFAEPAAIIDARLAGMDLALRRVLGERVDDPAIKHAADATRRAIEQGSVLGKPLFAGWSAVPWPTEPHLALWLGTTVLREHRSGCHLLALGASGLSGCEAVVSQVLVDQAPEVWIEDEAGWSADEAAAARAALTDRGWCDQLGTATALAHEERARIEAVTDDLDDVVWRGIEDAEQTRTTLQSIVEHFPPDDQLDWKSIYEPPEENNT